MNFEFTGKKNFPLVNVLIIILDYNMNDKKKSIFEQFTFF
jgi:hypothetical protein